MNDFRPPLAFGFGLTRDRPDHRFVKVHVLHFHRGDLDSPCGGLAVEHLLNVEVELFARGQQLIELVFAQHSTQRRLRKLARCLIVVLDLDHRLGRIENAEVDDRVHLDRHVVARDHVLRRHIHDDGAQVDAHHLLHDRNEEEKPRSLDLPETAEHENHRTLVFAQDAERRHDDQQDDDDDSAKTESDDHDQCPSVSSGWKNEPLVRIRDGLDRQHQIAARGYAHALSALDRYGAANAPLLAMNARPAFGFHVIERNADAPDQRFVAAHDRAPTCLERKRRNKENEQCGDRDQGDDQSAWNAESRHIGVDQHHRAYGKGDDSACAERTKSG